MTEPIRLSKRLAELVGCSRREAELYIEGGWVQVDGQTVEAPYFKVQTQRIELLLSTCWARPLAGLRIRPGSRPCSDTSLVIPSCCHWSRT